MELKELSTLVLIEERKLLEKYVHSGHFHLVEEHIQAVMASYLGAVCDEIDRRRGACVRLNP